MDTKGVGELLDEQKASLQQKPTKAKTSVARGGGGGGGKKKAEAKTTTTTTTAKRGTKKGKLDTEDQHEDSDDEMIAPPPPSPPPAPISQRNETDAEMGNRHSSDVERQRAEDEDEDENNRNNDIGSIVANNMGRGLVDSVNPYQTFNSGSLYDSGDEMGMNGSNSIRDYHNGNESSSSSSDSDNEGNNWFGKTIPVGSISGLRQQSMKDGRSMKKAKLFSQYLNESEEEDETDDDEKMDGTSSSKKKLGAYAIFQQHPCKTSFVDDTSYRHRSLSLKKNQRSRQKHQVNAGKPRLVGIAVAFSREEVIEYFRKNRIDMEGKTMIEIDISKPSSSQYFETVVRSHVYLLDKKKSHRTNYIYVWTNLFTDDQLKIKKSSSNRIRADFNDPGKVNHLLTIGSGKNDEHVIQLKKWVKHFIRDGADEWLEAWEANSHKQKCIRIDIDSLRNNPTTKCNYYSL